jgi:hypothetical protein
MHGVLPDPVKVLPWWVVAVAAGVSLGAAWVLKEPCIDTPWDDHFQYRNYCYSDIQALWTGKGLDRDVTQYVDQENEYPVLTGWFMQLSAFLTDDLHDYLVVSFLLLLACGAGTTVGLWRAGLPRELVLAWCLVPTLPIHGLTNWDLLAVVFAVWGWALWRRGHPLWSGLCFGLGGAAKLYPAFFLPFLFLAALQARDRRAASRVFLGGFLGLGVPNLIVAWMSFDGWFATWTFHAGRHPDFETPWQAFVEHFLRPIFPDYDWGTDWRHLVDRISITLMLAVTVWLGTRVWNRRLDGLVAGGVFSLAFLLVNKVYSPQYTLWAVPLLLLLGAAWRPLMLFVTADFVNFLVRYRLFTPPEGQSSGWNPAWDDWSLLAINARWAFLAWATWTVVRRHGIHRIGPPAPFGPPGTAPGPEAKGQDTRAPEAFEA